jgi:hypothetical protein
MHRTIVRSIAAATAAVVALTVGPPAGASDVAHTNVASTTPATFTPHLFANGFKPYALTINQAGDQMVVGGKFNAVENSTRTQTYTRSNVFAFNRFTGAVNQAFDPVLNGQVWSVVGHGDDVYIAGEFTTVNGVTRNRVAKLSVSTGEVDLSFNPNVAIKGARATDLELAGGRLYVGGAFGRKLVALDPDTGALLPYVDIAIADPLRYTSRAEVFRFDVSPDGSKLVAVGNFRTVGGATRHRAFMLDLGAGGASLSPWYYTPLERECHAAAVAAVYQYYVKDVDFSPNSQFFTFASTGGHRINGEGPGQVLCDSAARFSVSNLSPTVPYWINYTGGDTLHSVIDTGAAVYVQGHSRWLDNPYGADYAGPGAVERPGGGAIDPVTGKALSWSPEMPQQKGGYQIFANSQGVWFATDGLRFGGKYKRGLRLAPVS